MKRFARCPAVLWTLLAAAALLVATANVARAAQDDPARVGRKIENFTLEDYRGTARSLAELADAKLVVVAFMGTECPLANLYTPRLAELAAEFESQGVAFLGINSNQQDSITEVASHAQRHKIPFHVLKDPGNKVADQFGAVRTPEVFVLDGDRVVRYWGRIDDQFGIGYQKSEPTRNDLDVAIDELLAGKAVSVATTTAPGCLIGRVQRPEPSGDVTYSNQIARIMNDALRRMPSRRANRAVFAYRLRRSRRLGRDDARSDSRAPDAALAGRPGPRRVQEQSLHVRRGDCAGRSLGGKRLSRGRSGRNAGAGRVCLGLGHFRARRSLLPGRRAIHHSGRRRRELSVLHSRSGLDRG